jgi:hypothetical protein
VNSALPRRRYTSLLHNRIMNTARCVRCGSYWSFNSGPIANFEVISRWCPDCVEVAFPVSHWSMIR